MVYFSPPLKENLVLAEKKKTLVAREWYRKRLCKQAETCTESYAVTLNLDCPQVDFPSKSDFYQVFCMWENLPKFYVTNAAAEKVKSQLLHYGK